MHQLVALFTSKVGSQPAIKPKEVWPCDLSPEEKIHFTRITLLNGNAVLFISTYFAQICNGNPFIVSLYKDHILRCCCMVARDPGGTVKITEVW